METMNQDYMIYSCSSSLISINKCNNIFNTSRFYIVSCKRIEANDQYLNNYGIGHVNRALKILRKIKPLFLEKQYSFFFLIYTANILLRSILFKLNLTESDSFLNGELLELHMYSVLLIDTLFKNNRLIKSKSKFK